MVVGNAANILNFTEYASRYFQYRSTGDRNFDQMLAAAPKNLQAQFIFELADLLAYAGLRGVETFRGGGDIKAVARDLPDVT